MMILVIAVIVSFPLLVKLKLEKIIKFQQEILHSMTKHGVPQHTHILKNGILVTELRVYTCTASVNSTKKHRILRTEDLGFTKLGLRIPN